jgi:hypothetical protein
MIRVIVVLGIRHQREGEGCLEDKATAQVIATVSVFL